MSELHGKRILVADDDAMVRFILTDELEVVGGIVTDTVDGEAALSILTGGAEFDLLVTDIRMPKLDGWTLAEQARQLRPDLPVLYVTGWSDVDPRAVPRSEVLSKPFRPAQLVMAAARLLQAPAA